MTGQWYCSRAGRPIGPLTVDELRRMVADGQLAPDDLVVYEGQTGWRRVLDCPELFARPVLPPDPIDPAPVGTLDYRTPRSGRPKNAGRRRPR